MKFLRFCPPLAVISLLGTALLLNSQFAYSMTSDEDEKSEETSSKQEEPATVVKEEKPISVQALIDLLQNKFKYFGFDTLLTIHEKANKQELSLKQLLASYGEGKKENQSLEEILASIKKPIEVDCKIFIQIFFQLLQNKGDEPGFKLSYSSDSFDLDKSIKYLGIDPKLVKDEVHVLDIMKDLPLPDKGLWVLELGEDQYVGLIGSEIKIWKKLEAAEALIQSMKKTIIYFKESTDTSLSIFGDDADGKFREYGDVIENPNNWVIQNIF